jgi:hypothetical protein
MRRALIEIEREITHGCGMERVRQIAKDALDRDGRAPAPSDYVAEIERLKTKNRALYKKIAEQAADAYELCVRAEAAEDALALSRRESKST